MAEKELGYVELVWTCKQCGTKNPGRQKTCANCGAVRAADVQLELPAEQNLITDAEVLKGTGYGADIHCPYCNAPNRGDAEVCVQCGGKLAGGQVRPHGKVIGAYQSGPAAQVRCPACNSLNHPDAPRCQNCGAALGVAPAPAGAPAATKASVRPKATIFIIAALVGVVICVALGFALIRGLRTSKLSGVVEGMKWERSVEVMELQPVEHETWKDMIPSGAAMGECRDEIRRVQAEPVAGAEEVCGTPYTVDQGNGVAKVVQNCEYRVYEPYCSYIVDEWVLADVLRQDGSDMNPRWPNFTFSGELREGQRSENYQVVFSAGGERYVYTTSNPQEYAQFARGSEWMLEVNAFGAVTSVQPK
jgi:membrane protease subunit (stomatin/prohibitin family)